VGLITGYMPARVVHVAVQLGVADLLAGEAKTADALAQETNTAAVPLRRRLLALASLGLVEQLESGRFALTEAGSPPLQRARFDAEHCADVRRRSRLEILGRTASQCDDRRIRDTSRFRPWQLRISGCKSGSGGHLQCGNGRKYEAGYGAADFDLRFLAVSKRCRCGRRQRCTDGRYSGRQRCHARHGLRPAKRRRGGVEKPC
jgi:hypothetical protein